MKIQDDNPIKLEISGSLGVISAIMDNLTQQPIGTFYLALQKEIGPENEIKEILFDLNETSCYLIEIRFFYQYMEQLYKQRFFWSNDEKKWGISVGVPCE